MEPVQQTLDHLLKVLVCTGCGRGGLSFESGTECIVCSGCGKRHPVINGVPCFVPDELVNYSEVDEAVRPAFLEAKRLAYSGNSFINRMYNHYHHYAATQRLKISSLPLSLDIGCGMGEHYPFITERELAEGSYIGVDLDRFKLEHLSACHPEIPLVQGNVFTLPFPNEKFDLVQLLATLEHFGRNDIDRVLDESLRVLKPGGKLIACYPAEGGILLKTGQVLMHALIRLRSGFDLNNEKIHCHLSTASEIGQILENRDDLEHVETNYYPFGIPSINVSLFVNRVYLKNRVQVL